MFLRSLFGLETLIAEAAVNIHNRRGPSRTVLAKIHDAIDEAVVIFVLVDFRHFNSSRSGCSFSLITLYDSNGTNHIYNFAITIQTQTAAPKQAEQTATRKRTQARRHPEQATAARRAGDGEKCDPSRPAPSQPTSRAGRSMTASRTARGAIEQGGDDITRGERDARRDEKRDVEETGRQAGRGAGRKSHIRAMERMCMNSDSIDFLIEYIYIKL